MAQTPEFSLPECFLVIDGQRITGGGSGGFISIEAEGDAYTFKRGQGGEPQVSRTNADGAVMTITQLFGGRGVEILERIRREKPNGFSVSLTHTSGAIDIECDDAVMMTGFPGVTLGNEADDVEYVIQLPTIRGQLGILPT